MKIKGHQPKNTPSEHMKEFYRDFDQLKNTKYDGMIITGAPVEQLPFEEVTYWDEMKDIFSIGPNITLHRRCLFAGRHRLRYFIIMEFPNIRLPKKMFGVFEHTNSNEKLADFQGFR
jgi:homoserine O-succinyltransferase/O-acetyltransferase